MTCWPPCSPSTALARAWCWRPPRRGAGARCWSIGWGAAAAPTNLLATLRDLPLDGPGYLEAWRATRAWLRRRVPAQIAEVADPLEALQRLRGHLDVLERRLERQELALRGSSEDIARGIDVQVRRAHAQVRRLTAQLAGVAFGSIGGIRVRQIRRVETHGAGAARAARRRGAGAAVPGRRCRSRRRSIEVFRRFGGGRGAAGGQRRLLDYREYVELVVEVQSRRRAPTGSPRAPARLSTGEAIGVGAAGDDGRADRVGTRRPCCCGGSAGGGLASGFLFLDEANRLSRDNLGVLFELCRAARPAAAGGRARGRARRGQHHLPAGPPRRRRRPRGGPGQRGAGPRRPRPDPLRLALDGDRARAALGPAHGRQREPARGLPIVARAGHGPGPGARRRQSPRRAASPRRRPGIRRCAPAARAARRTGATAGGCSASPPGAGGRASIVGTATSAADSSTCGRGTTMRGASTSRGASDAR
jgi:hypothetical protein